MSAYSLRQLAFSLALKLPFKLLDYLWPKDSNLVIFSGGRHIRYSDNTRYLFEKFIDVYASDVKPLWVTPLKDLPFDEGIDETIRRRMVYQYSIEGILSLLRARTVFFCWGFPDLPGTEFSRRTVTIQLWHGIPIKRIGVCGKSVERRGIGQTVRAYRRFTYWICSSRIERNSIALCTGIPIDRVKITGYPRNDYLIEHRESQDAKILGRFPFLNKRVILYAPTWRGDSRVRFFPFDDFNLDELESFLEKNDSYLILRTHHADDIAASDSGVDYEAWSGDRVIVLNRNSLRDVQDILPFVDILISDYSGIWVDFLLLNRPIVFVPYDLAAYEEREGLLYDYEFITPGPKVSRFSDLLTEMESYLSDPSRDSERRNQIKRMFHQYEDGKAYERIYQLTQEKNAVSGEYQL